MVFKFRLQQVLEIREEELQDAQKQLAEAFRAVEEAKVLLEHAKEDLKTTQEEMLKDNYQMAEAYLNQIRRLDKLVEERELGLKTAEDNVIKAREALLQARIKVEALEKLREKQEEEYNDTMNKLEQKQTDEDVSIKFARQLIESNDDEVDEYENH